MAKEKINGIELSYHVTGQGEALVLIHGHPFDHTMWYPQVVALSDEYKIITPDLRGYGESSLPRRKATKFEDYATDTLKLLDFLGVENFHIGGLSMGGQIAMEVFSQASERVKSLILADTFAGLDTPEAKKARNEGAKRLEHEGMKGYANEVIGKMIKTDHVNSMPEVAAHVMKMMTSSSPAGAATAMRARSERIDYLNEVLPNVTIPTLVIVGRQDEFTPVAKAEEMEQQLPDCKLVIIEDAGHMPNLEHPDEFNKAVFDFLDNI
jgi:3-oxoadipate enol-lactonase